MRANLVRPALGVGILTAALGASACSGQRAAYTYTAPPGTTVAYRADIPPKIVVPKAEPIPATRVAPAPVVTPREDALASRIVKPAAAPCTAPRSVAPPSSARAINATCPVMLGNPVDLRFTSSWQGRMVAFSDASAKSMWDAAPERYAVNLPGAASASLATAAVPPVTVPAPAAKPLRAASPAPAAASVTVAPAADEDEDCPGGNCRIPGR